MIFSGCVSKNESSTDIPTDSSLLSIPSAVDSIRSERDAILKEYQQYVAQTSAATEVYVGGVFASEWDTLTSLRQLTDRMKNYDMQKATYSAREDFILKAIYPNRDTSIFELNRNELIIKDPDEFWRYNRYCIVIFYDTIMNSDTYPSEYYNEPDPNNSSY